MALPREDLTPTSDVLDLYPGCFPATGVDGMRPLVLEGTGFLNPGCYPGAYPIDSDSRMSAAANMRANHSFLTADTITPELYARPDTCVPFFKHAIQVRRERHSFKTLTRATAVHNQRNTRHRHVL